MPRITREIELTPADVVQVLRRIGPEEWQELQLELLQHSIKGSED